MSLYGAFDKTNHLSELGDPLPTGSGVTPAATRRVTALRNLLGDSNITLAQVTALSGVTPGTVTASKALVVDANKDLASLRHLTLTGNLVSGATTLSEADLALVDGLTVGTIAASKAVTVDANKDVAQFRNLRTVRTILGSGAAASINTAGAGTYTAANILTGTIVRDPAGGDRTDTLDTAANIVAAIPGATVGDIIDFKLVNGADAAETITVDAGAGGTYDTNQQAASRVVGQNQGKIIRIRLTDVGSGTEAYVVYI